MFATIGAHGKVENIGLANVAIHANSGLIGALVGENDGSIIEEYRQKIAAAKMPESVEKQALRELTRLEKMGEHVHHLCFTTADVPGALAKLSSQGIEIASNGQTFNDPDMPWQRWGWVSPKSAHGVMLEVAAPYESHHDGKWYPAETT